MSHKKILISIYKELISKLKNIEFIESLTLIGKPIIKRKPDKIIDIDTLIIVRQPMNYRQYKIIQTTFANICKKYTSNELDVLYAIADGPMKPKSHKKKEIFLHGILHTKNSYIKMPLVLCKISWQKFKPIKGKPIKNYQSFKKVNKKMLLNSALGINHLIELVTNDSSGYIGWKKGKDNIMKWDLFPLKFKHKSEKVDLYIYSALRAASNSMRFITGKNSFDIDRKMAKVFSQEFSKLESNNFPLKLIEKKKQLRNNVYKGSSELLKKQTLDFLKGLKQYIKNNY